MNDEMIHIQKVHVEGYKSIVNAEVEFLPGLNVIIGKNGAGKSNLFKVINAAIGRDGPSAYLDDVEVYLAMPDEQIVAYSLRFDGMKPMHQLPDQFEFLGRSDVPAIPEDQGSSPKISELVLIDHSVPKEIPFLDFPISFEIEPSKGELSWLMEYVLNQKIPQFSSLSFATLFLILKGNIKPQDNSKQGIESSLRAIFESALGFGHSVMDYLVDYTPIDDVRINLTILGQDEGDGAFKVRNVCYEFKVGGKWHDYSSLSDGTKRMVYVIFSIGMPRGFLVVGDKKIKVKGDVLQKVILFEEPELGIHPHQLYQLLQFLKSQSRKHQIIITTHSPSVLDIIGREELDRIIIASYDDKLGSTFKHLDDDQKSKALAYMKEDFLSDYWRYSDLEPRTKLW